MPLSTVKAFSAANLCAVAQRGLREQASPTAGGACEGAGIPPRAVDDVLGVVKAYSTSVGGGPFPTELHDDHGAMLQEIGREFGATTRRPRRCGWFDGVAIGYASWLNGFTGLAVTKLDVLDHFDTIKLCTAYRLGDALLDYVPDTLVQARVEPVYETWPGWLADTSGCRAWSDLPPAAQAYLRRIETDPDNPQGYAYMATYLQESAGGPEELLKSYEKAAEFWQRRITLQPDSAEAWLALGVNQWSRSFRFQFLSANDRLKMANEALKSISKAIELDANYPEPYAWMGPLYKAVLAKLEPEKEARYNAEGDRYLEKFQELRKRAAERKKLEEELKK